VPAPVNKTDLAACIERLNKGRILVIGDLAIDEMVYGSVDRLSREAPVLILRHNRTDIILGAAANAAHNLASLGAVTYSVGVMGADYNAGFLQQALKDANIRLDGLLVDEERPTTTKSRISGTVNQSVTQQVVRIDREDRSPLSPALQKALLDRVEALAPHVDALLLSDYGLGVFTPDVIAGCLALADRFELPVAVDSQGELSLFSGATIMTPNQPEAEQNLKRKLHGDDDFLNSGLQLLQQAEAKNLLITRGQDGMVLYEGATGCAHFIPVFNPSEVFDVTGAGDTVVATLTLALATGSSLLQAAVLGNLAASLVVRHYGCATTTPQALSQALEALNPELLKLKTQQLLPFHG
jgi:D-glycero-beta-D-manno-heptose-7-phosphate kinase